MRQLLYLVLVLAACSKKPAAQQKTTTNDTTTSASPFVIITSPAGAITESTSSVEVVGNATVVGDVITSVSYTLNQGQPSPVIVQPGASVSFDFTVANLAPGVNSIVVSASTQTATGQSSALLVSYDLSQQSFSPPVAADQNVTAVTENATAVTLTGASPTIGATLSFALVSEPSHGTLTGTAPNLSYRSSEGFTGSDSFTFTLNDGSQTSAEGTVSVGVVAGTTIYVDWKNGLDTNSGRAPDRAKQTLNAGVAAVSGTYNIVSAAGGTYAETLTVTQSMTLEGPAVSGALVAGTNEPGLVIQPPAIATTPNGLVTIIEVGDATDAGGTSPAFEMDNVKVDGSLLGPSIVPQSGTRWYGVTLHVGASAKIQNSFFYYERLSDIYLGDQTGIAIHANQANLDVENCLITQAGKQGITVDGVVPPAQGVIQFTMKNSHFVGTNPTTASPPTQNSENAVVLWDSVQATITGNLFEGIGLSGTDTADFYGAEVATDGTTGTAILYYLSDPATFTGTNPQVVSGNTFRQSQTLFYDAIYSQSSVAPPIFAAAFLTDNTFDDGGYISGTAAAGTEVDGQRSDDANFLDYEIAMQADADCLSGTAASCVTTLLPGTYTLTIPLQDLTAVKPAGLPGMTLIASGGSVTLNIPNSSLPAGYTIDPSVTVMCNGVQCP